MRIIRSETVSNQSRGHHSNEGRVRLCHRGSALLGACAFYHIWIPQYAHIADPLYGLLKKTRKFEWVEEHTEAIRRLKQALSAAPALRKAEYTPRTPIYITVDTSPIGIGWVVNQEGEDGTRFPIRFGAKVLSE